MGRAVASFTTWPVQNPEMSETPETCGTESAKLIGAAFAPSLTEGDDPVPISPVTWTRVPAGTSFSSESRLSGSEKGSDGPDFTIRICCAEGLKTFDPRNLPVLSKSAAATPATVTSDPTAGKSCVSTWRKYTVSSFLPAASSTVGRPFLIPVHRTIPEISTNCEKNSGTTE